MSERREPTRIPMGGVDKCLLCGWQGQPDEPHGCPRYTDSAAKPLRSRLDRMCDEVDGVYDEFRRLEAILAAYRRAFIGDSQDQGMLEADAIEAANDLEALAAVTV